MAKRFLFVGGGTAGPVTPLLAVMREIQKRDAQASFHWVGTYKGPERALIAREHIAFSPLIAAKIDRFFSLRNFFAPFFFLAACVQARRVLKMERPDVIVAAGAFVSVPIVWMGKLMGIPSVIHQLDVRAGLANKLSAPAASAVTVTFPSSAEAFSATKTSCTGAPVRPEILQPKTHVLPLRSDKPVVLVFGGGTGAQAINDLTVAAADEVLQHAQILHITGKGKGAKLEKPDYHQFEFLTDEMGEALHKATIVVTRAGLGTFLELAALRKPAIVIPMPNSHQEENAAMLWQAHAAIVLDQSQISPQEFASKIIGLLKDETKRAQLSANIAKFYQPDSAAKIVDKIWEVASPATEV